MELDRWEGKLGRNVRVLDAAGALQGLALNQADDARFRIAVY